MVRTTTLVVAAVVSSVALSGCSGCTPTRSAHAQDLDGGVVQQRTVVVTVPVPTEPMPEPDAPASCFARAESRTNLVDAQITELCTGAWSTAPVDCYLEARRRLRVTDEQKILLCRCASSASPVACHRNLTRRAALTDAQATSLCAPTLVLGLLPNCRPIGY